MCYQQLRERKAFRHFERQRDIINSKRLGVGKRCRKVDEKSIGVSLHSLLLNKIQLWEEIFKWTHVEKER